MSNANYLFSGPPSDEHINYKRASMEQAINKVTDPDHLSDVAAMYGDQARIEPCVIDRAAATFDVDETSSAIKITLTIPVDGDTGLLNMRVPREQGENVLVRAHHQRTSSWGGQPKVGPRIKIVESFPAGTSTEDVRAKVKQAADAIEANLTLINASVDQYNASIPAEVERLVEARRHVLETSASLRDGLGGGI